VDDEDSYSEESDHHSVSMDNESAETQSVAGEEPASDAAPEPDLSTSTARTEIFATLDGRDFDALVASSAALATPFEELNTFSMVSETAAGTAHFPNYWHPVDLNGLSAVVGTFAPTYPVHDDSTLTRWEPTTVDELSTSSSFTAPSINIPMHDFSVGFLDWTTLLEQPSSSEFSSPPHISWPVNPLKRCMEVEEKSHESTTSRKRSRTAEWSNLL